MGGEDQETSFSLRSKEKTWRSTHVMSVDGTLKKTLGSFAIPRKPTVRQNHNRNSNEVDAYEWEV